MAIKFCSTGRMTIALALVAAMTLGCNTFEEPLSYEGPGGDDGGQSATDGGVGGMDADSSADSGIDSGHDAGPDAGPDGGAVSWTPSGPFAFPTLDEVDDTSSCSAVSLPEGSSPDANFSLGTIERTNGDEIVVASYLASDGALEVATWERGAQEASSIYSVAGLQGGSAKADAAVFSDQWLGAGIDLENRVVLVRCSFVRDEPECRHEVTSLSASHVSVAVSGNQFRVYTLTRKTMEEAIDLLEYEVPDDEFALVRPSNLSLFDTPEIEGVGYLSVGYTGSGVVTLAAHVPAADGTGQYEFLRQAPGTLNWLYDGPAASADFVTTDRPKVAFFNSTNLIWGAIGDQSTNRSLEMYRFDTTGSEQWNGSEGLLEDVAGFGTAPVFEGYVEAFLEPMRLKVVADVAGVSRPLLDLGLTVGDTYAAPVEVTVAEGLPVVGLRSPGGSLELLPVCPDPPP